MNKIFTRSNGTMTFVLYDYIGHCKIDRESFDTTSTKEIIKKYFGLRTQEVVRTTKHPINIIGIEVYFTDRPMIGLSYETKEDRDTDYQKILDIVNSKE